MSNSRKPSKEPVNIAIIGGGFGGCSTAYFLRQLFGSNAQISLFEKSGRLGGRVKSITVDDKIYETGGAIFTSSNKYMNALVEKFNLTKNTNTEMENHLALYSGNNQTVFSSFQGFSFLNNLRFLWKYGYDFFKLKFHGKKFAKQFSKIYDLQDAGTCYATPSALLTALNPEFLRMTGVTFSNWLENVIGLRKAFCDDVAYGFVSNCYCQGFDVHAFVGLFASIGCNYNLYSIVGGNEQLAQRMAQFALQSNPQASPTTFLHAEVKLISTGKNKRYRLDYVDQNANDKKSFSEYDYVVLAVPLNQETTVSSPNGLLPPTNNYCEMSRTNFNGELMGDNLGFLKNSVKERVNSATVLPTRTGYENSPSTLFRSIISQSSSNYDQKSNIKCWSVFSEKKRVPDPAKQLQTAYFQNGTCISSVKWLAYPSYNALNNPGKDLGKFILSPGLIYPNALEQAASCMEMALVSGRNAALIIKTEHEKESHQ